ncbi:MAG: RNA methyltransferase [Bacteroidales bacterium]|nr:RNA methyltransferase [Bacteroidales bacterium]
MLSKNEIKEIRALGQKKFRDERGLFVVEGEKLVEEAMRSGFDIVGHYRMEEIGEETMARISQLTHPSPVLAVVRQPSQPALPSVEPDELVLALDGIRDPGNLGTILRIADWFGIRHVLASADTVELYNPKVVQATMGAIFRVQVYYGDLTRSFASLRMTAVYGTFLEGDTIYQTPLTKGGILVMGSEANGISPEVAATVTQKLYIPPYPAGAHTSESLNVAVATAIACSEFRRR